MYRAALSCTFATIASAVKAQNTWPWHRHMWRESYLSRLDFSKVSSASTHAHKSPEPRCYLPTTHTRANKGSHPRPNQNPNFFQERWPKMQSSSKCWPTEDAIITKVLMAEDAIIIKVLTGRRCNHHQSVDDRRCNHHQSAVIIIKAMTTILKTLEIEGPSTHKV